MNTIIQKNLRTPIILLSEIDADLRDKESDLATLEKCGTLLGTISNSLSMSMIFEGSPEQIAVATGVLSRCCKIVAKHSVSRVFEADSIYKDITFSNFSLVFIKLYCQEILMTYANLLKQSKEKGTSEGSKKYKPKATLNNLE